jgi:hypothetical protein
MATNKYQEYYVVKDILRHISRGVFEYQMATGKFPRPIQSSVGKKRWKKETVERWIKAYNMNTRKRWKTVNPMLRLFEDKDSGDYLLFPPAKGLALEWDGTLSHAFVLKPNEMVLAKEIGFTQCPDFPRCQTCQSYDFNLKGFLAMYTEIER